MARREEKKRSLAANSPALFWDLEEEARALILDWIRTYIQPSKRKDDTRSSYGLKHACENFYYPYYLGNGELKGAMAEAGYEGEEIHGGINRLYRVKVMTDAELDKKRGIIRPADHYDRNGKRIHHYEGGEA
jgi:hypothetical protein